MAVGNDVCMIHDFEGETAAADDDCVKLLLSMETGGAESGCHMRCHDILEKTSS